MSATGVRPPSTMLASNGAREPKRQARGRAEAQHAQGLVVQQDRAQHVLRLALDEAHDRREHGGQRRAARHLLEHRELGVVEAADGRAHDAIIDRIKFR